MARNIALVGSGPTGLYTLATLVERVEPLQVTIYESADLAGVGMPYSPDATHVTMLANIASIEIPPLTETYLDWLQRQPRPFLTIYGVDPDTLHERQFLPRLLLGGYFRDQFETLIAKGRDAGHQIALRERCRVTDLEAVPEGIRLTAVTGTEAPVTFFHDAAILATGHLWPEEDQDTPTYYLSPWSGLPEADIPAGRIGVLGTSLSALDASMAIATQHGRFEEDAEGAAAVYVPKDPDCTPMITLMSRSGVLPEADFYCPLPYEPLDIFTQTTVDAAIAAGADGLLDRLFALLSDQLATCDPGYARQIGLGHLTADTFAAAYFAAREECDPFDYAARNLAEVLANREAQHTVAWRYAILRMHEVFGTAVPSLTDEDLGRFDAGLKRVFVDNYAAIPPKTVARLLALRDAGLVEVLRLGADYDLEQRKAGVAVSGEDGKRRFDVFIDARGQRALDLSALPFQALRNQLARGSDPKGREIPLDASFRIAIPDQPEAEIFLAAIPFLMRRRPFIQGITASSEIGECVGRSVAHRPPAPAAACSAPLPTSGASARG